MKNQDSKKLSTPTLIGIILIVASVFFFACGIIMLVMSNNSDTGDKEESRASSSVPQATVPQIAASEVTQATTEEPVTHTSPDHIYNMPEPQQDETAPQIPDLIPDDMKNLLANGGISANALEASNSQQLVTVKSNGSSAGIRFFEKSGDGKWTEDKSLACDGFVGSKGTVDYAEMSERLEATPKGLYSIGEAFYQDNKPQTGLSSFEITDDTYWVDDPDSDYYNQMVNSTEGWNSAEHMIEIPYYKYGFVINYNVDPALKGKGSAIFFHCKEEETHGCVAAPEYNVLRYLKKLDASKSPYILIIWATKEIHLCAATTV